MVCVCSPRGGWFVGDPGVSPTDSFLEAAGGPAQYCDSRLRTNYLRIISFV